MIFLNTAGDTIRAEASAASAITITVGGIETVGGTDTYLQLGQAQIASGSQTTLYTVPSSTTTVAAEFIIANTTSTNRTVNIWRVPNAGAISDSNAIAKGVMVPANTTIVWNKGAISAIPTAPAIAGITNGLITAIGFDATNLTTVTVAVTNTSYFVYLGRVSQAFTTFAARYRVTTAAVTITWAEIGIFKGAIALGAAASLSRVGFTDCAAIINSTGQKTTNIALTGVAAGDDLWFAYGSQATTPAQFRGGLADDLQSGRFQSFAGRISTMAVPSTCTLTAATLAPIWANGQFS